MKLNLNFHTGDHVVHKVHKHEKGVVEKVRGFMITVLVTRKMPDGTYCSYRKTYNRKNLKKTYNLFAPIIKFIKEF